MKKTILIDFDGVIHSYKSKWKGYDQIPDEPVEGIKELISELRNDYLIKVYSTRCLKIEGLKAIKEWLNKYKIKVDGFTSKKEPAFLIIDDRCLCFKGNCTELKEQIKNFKVWNR